MTDLAAGRHSDSRLLWLKTKRSPSESHTGGDVDHLLQQDAESQHRKSGHGVKSLKPRPARCFWRQRPLKRGLSHNNHKQTSRNKNKANLLPWTDANVWYLQNSMNLPPDKARLLRQYDNEKKWDLICDQVCNTNTHLPAHSLHQTHIALFSLLCVFRRGFRWRIHLTPTSRSSEDTWILESPERSDLANDLFIAILKGAQLVLARWVKSDKLSRRFWSFSCCIPLWKENIPHTNWSF